MYHHRRSKALGQGLVEYALILVLVAVAVVASLSVLGPEVGNVFCDVTKAVDGYSELTCEEYRECQGNNGQGQGQGKCNNKGNNGQGQGQNN